MRLMEWRKVAVRQGNQSLLSRDWINRCNVSEYLAPCGDDYFVKHIDGLSDASFNRCAFVPGSYRILKSHSNGDVRLDGQSNHIGFARRLLRLRLWQAEGQCQQNNAEARIHPSPLQYQLFNGRPDSSVCFPTP